MAPAPVTPGMASSRCRSSRPNVLNASRCVIALVGQRDAERQLPIGAKARIDALNRHERAHEQGRADEQHDAQRDLHDDQRRAHPIADRRRHRPRRRLQRSAGFRSPQLGQRRQREQQTPQHRHAEREREDGEIDPRRAEPRQRFGTQREQHAQAGVSDDQAGGGAEQREDQAFGERLPQQPSARRAERQPQRRFTRARRGPRDQQARDVDARDHQQDRHAGEQRQQRPANLPHIVRLQRHGVERAADRAVFGVACG